MLNLKKQFTKIYKQHTEPIVRHYLDQKTQYKPIAYTAYAGRNRFRAGLAYILSGKTNKGKAIGAAAEIMWATCLIYDDIGDKDVLRRGKPAAWKKFGLLWSVHSAALGLNLAKQLLKDYNLNNKTIAFLEENFLTTLKSQIEQGGFTLSTSPSKILQNYFDKGALGKWPIEAAVQINKKINKKNQRSIALFALNLSVAAQIKNDLQDVIADPKVNFCMCMRDIREGIVTYPISVFCQKASERDKKFFRENIWAKKRLLIKKYQPRAISLFKKYKVLDYSNKKLQKIVDKSLNSLKSVREKNVKDILLTWGKLYKFL